MQPDSDQQATAPDLLTEKAVQCVLALTAKEKIELLERMKGAYFHATRTSA